MLGTTIRGVLTGVAVWNALHELNQPCKLRYLLRYWICLWVRSSRYIHQYRCT